VLSSLTAGAAEDAAARLELVGFAEVEQKALAAPPALDALAFLAPAERVKITDPASLASTYQSAGASTVSVLTEGRKFKGSLRDLELVRDAVSIPVLRKDFITLDYQVFEARAAGADLVLLIVAALDQPTLVHLHELISSLGMTPLVETHSADEVERALDVGASLVGVNARNLSTYELDRDLFGTLADRIPAGIIRVAESAVKTAADVSHYRSSGADVVLVGEALVTGDPARTLEEFLGVS
jgi:indole-3-glycerol phosphate synthase